MPLIPLALAGSAAPSDAVGVWFDEPALTPEHISAGLQIARQDALQISPIKTLSDPPRR